MPHFSGWEMVNQCFQITRSITDKKRVKTTKETVYGITSLPLKRADSKRLLELNRGHWRVENQLHWVRDAVFFEDKSNLQTQNAQIINASCNSFAIFILQTMLKFSSIKTATETCADNKYIPINALL